MTPQPFKITIKAHGNKYSVELPHSDIDLDTLHDAIRGVVLAAGWSEDTFEQILTK